MASAAFKVGFGASYYTVARVSSVIHGSTLHLSSSSSGLSPRLNARYQTHLEMPIHDDLPILLKYSKDFSALCKIAWPRKYLDMNSTVSPASRRSSDRRSSSSGGHHAWNTVTDVSLCVPIVVCLSFQANALRMKTARSAQSIDGALAERVCFDYSSNDPA